MSAVEIIAEVGVNHQNDLDQAKRLIDAAKEAGADIAKFQASTVHGEVSYKHAPEHFKLIRSVVPSFEFLEACKAHCDAVGIEFLCTPAEEESLKFLVGLGVKRIKIGSDNLTNPFILEAARDTGLPIILSTGMADMQEISRLFEHNGGVLFAETVTLMHCGSAYPLPIGEANLYAIPALRQLGLERPIGFNPRATYERHFVGFSDHTPSITLPAVAVGLGAVMIEKHLTLDVDAEGPDHRASLMPMQFAMMVEAIRETEAAMGDGFKRPMPSEMENRKLMRKSLMARKPIKVGERFTTLNLTAKRPGTGRSPMHVIELFGKPSPRDYDEDEFIT